MQFRIALYYGLPESGQHPKDPLSFYKGLIDHVVQAEDLGFDIAWIAEHPTKFDAILQCSPLICATCAARTQSIRIGAVISSLPSYHPLRVAEDAATLDGIADGRCELAVVLDPKTDGSLGSGPFLNGQSTRLEEEIEILRQSWSNKPVQWQGKYFSIVETIVAPKPVQSGGPPLWLGGGDGAERAARLGLGLFLPALANVENYVGCWRESGRYLEEMRIAFPLVLDLKVSHVIDSIRKMVLSCGKVGYFDVVVPAMTEKGRFCEPHFLKTVLENLRHELMSLTD